MHLGYARVSTDAQDLTNQRTELAAAGCTKLFAEKLTGAQRDRPELTRMLDHLRAGDVVTVTRLDRLARSTRVIHILSHAAQRAGDEAISVGNVRTAAQQWYQASKDAAVSSHEKAKTLLTWIVDRVIKERQTKAFLLESGTRDELVDFLYDERVLHVLRKSMSAQDEPGKRFHVYGIDYGCYVDLINTNRAPTGLLDLGTTTAEISVIVPRTDFRSIRRCVLNLSDFYAQFAGASSPSHKRI